MNIEVNWLAVILATLSSMIVGAIWYAKPVFGKSWMQLLGKKEKDLTGGAAIAMGGTLVVSFITAFVLAHVAFLSHSFFQGSFFENAVTTAFWLWLGLTAARIITHDLFEKRPLKLTMLTVGHEFVTIMVMAAIIGWLHP